MGLFDFALFPGQRFNKVELSILDQNFNSISAYTKNKYRFYSRIIRDNILCVEECGVNYHEVTYTHIDINKDESNSNYIRRIECHKYHIPNEKIYYYGLKRFYDSDLEDGPKINVPKLKKFPTFVLQVGWHGNGFITEFKYNKDNIIDRTLEDSNLSDKCIEEIKNNSIKFLKSF